MPATLFQDSRLKLRSLRSSRLLLAAEILLRSRRAELGELELSLVGARAMRRLNAQYLHHDYATDVLSFPLESKPPRKQRPWHLGEIVICLPVAARQARQQGRSLNFQAIRLLVHGFTHLQGLDHELGDGERQRFERQEKRYLKRLNEEGLIRWHGSLQL